MLTVSSVICMALSLITHVWRVGSSIFSLVQGSNLQRAWDKGAIVRSMGLLPLGISGANLDGHDRRSRVGPVLSMESGYSSSDPPPSLRDEMHHSIIEGRESPASRCRISRN